MPVSPVILKTLQNTQIFSALDEHELNSLGARATLRKFGAGELLFSEGEPCKGLYIVVTGQVRIFKSSPNGREHVLSVEGPGGSIAELPVFDGGKYPASAAAVVPSELLFLARTDFRAMCLENPEVSLKVLQVVGGRLRRLVGIIEELSFTTVRDRLLAWLTRQARLEGDETPKGLVFTLDVSHQEIASQIGTVRELVSRNMSGLQAQGVIAISGKEITILQM